MNGKSGTVWARIAGLFAALAAAFLGSASAPAAENAQLGIELNKLTPRNGACRAFLVLENTTDNAFRSLKLDLVMFDTEGVVARRVAVQGAPLPVGKTSLKVFDMEGLSCPAISRVLLNDVMECEDASGKRDDCMGLISTSSRAAAPLVK